MEQHINSIASEEGLYPIRTVSEITGVNAITLRAWERRHGLFKPKRTPKGHRLYSEHDISVIQHVVQLLEKGISIGRVAKVLKSEVGLEDLNTSAENTKKTINNQWKHYHSQLSSSVATYDLTQLEQLHREIFSLYPLEVVRHQLLLPVINELRTQATKLPSLSGHYHFYRQFLQQRISSLFLKQNLQNRGKEILLVSCDGSQEDIELMLFGLPLLTHGYQIILLGSDLPFDAIPMALSRADSDGLILYSNIPQALDISLILSIKTIADAYAIPIFLLGDPMEQQAKQLTEQGLIVLDKNSVEQLKTIDTHLAHI